MIKRLKIRIHHPPPPPPPIHLHLISVFWICQKWFNWSSPNFLTFKTIYLSQISFWNWGQGWFPISVHLTKASKFWIDVFNPKSCGALSWVIASFGNTFRRKKTSRLIKVLDNRFYVKFMQLEIYLLYRSSFEIRNLRMAYFLLLW